MANFYRIGAGGLDWKTTGSWSTTSGGASNGIDEPTSSDVVRFDKSSPATATITTVAACSGFVSTNGITITLNGASLVISGTLSASTNCLVIFTKTASETVTVTNGITQTAANAIVQGSAKIILTGGTWTGNSSSSDFRNPLTLQPDTSDITIVTNIFSGSEIIYIPSTYDVTCTGTIIFDINCDLDLDGMSLNIVNSTPSSNPVITLLSNLTIATISTSGINRQLTFTKTASETVTVTNGISLVASSNGGLSGTADIYLTGGTWSSSVIGTGDNAINNNLFINGNVTIGATAQYATGTLTYVSGTITVTSSNLSLLGSCTLDTDGMTWNTVTPASTFTITINSTLSAATIILPTTLTFTGTSGFTTDTLQHTGIVASTITYGNGLTYTVDSLLVYSATVGLILFTSEGTAIFYLPNNGLTVCNTNASFTNINASSGRSINTFGGTITNCTNVNQYFDYKGVAL